MPATVDRLTACIDESLASPTDHEKDVSGTEIVIGGRESEVRPVS